MNLRQQILEKSETTDVIWKDIPGHSGYQVSNYGEVRSVDRLIKRKNDKFPHLRRGSIIRQQDNGHGYKWVRMGATTKPVYVHRLVLSVFSPYHTPDQTDVNHKDGNKENNNIENLEWCTRSENNLHAYDNDLHVYGENHPQSKYSLETIEGIKEMAASGERICDISRKMNISHQYVSKIVRGKNRRRG